jgi:hypothetical protein
VGTVIFGAQHLGGFDAAGRAQRGDERQAGHEHRAGGSPGEHGWIELLDAVQQPSHRP